MTDDKAITPEQGLRLNPQGDRDLIADFLLEKNELAGLLLDEKCYEEAIPHLEKILETEPCRAQDVVDLACACQQTGRYARAAELFLHVVNADGLNRSDKVALLERLGYCELGMGRYEQAVDAFENALSLDATSSRARVGFGLCMANTGKTSEARALFEEAIAIAPDCADAHSNLGVLALAEDNVNEALASFKRALEIQPMHRDALPNYLTTTFALGAFEEARSLLQCYVTSNPDNPDLLYQLAYCDMKLGRQHQARSLLQDLLKNDPGHKDAQDLLAECTTA